MNSLIKQQIKSIVGKVYSFSPNSSIDIKNHITIFMFHDVSYESTTLQKKYFLSVTPDEFIAQLEWIKRNFLIQSPIELLNKKSNLMGSAIITFDDGYLGTFKNALPILKVLKIPSLIFLNIGHINKSKPFIPGLVTYLTHNSKKFIKFCEENKIKKPFYLYITTTQLRDYSEYNELPSLEEIEKYSGKFASMNDLNEWENENVFYGNHLYEHWNYFSLSQEEFIDQYNKNKETLSQFNNHIDIFAFTNGIHPNLEHSSDLFAKLGTKKIFTISNGFNQTQNKLILGRVPMTAYEVNDSLRWYQLYRSNL